MPVTPGAGGLSGDLSGQKKNIPFKSSNTEMK